MRRLEYDDVVEIKRLLAEGKLQKKQIADMFGVSRGLIVDIYTGRVHRNVEFEYEREEKDSMKGKGNVLVIGDLHHPFCLDGYLEFCLEQKRRFKCKQVVFIGDVIDNHYPSYHETDPDGLSGGDELSMAVRKLLPWVKAFPKAFVTVGNHDRMVMRKAFSSGIPKQWIRNYNEVLGAPGWQFVDEVVMDNVQYIHGEGGTAKVKALNDKFSTVQGHLHTQAYVDNLIGRDTRIFGMQVGCGIDRRAYAMAYAKVGRKPAIGCGVVLDNGQLPIQIMADLNEKRFKSAAK